MHDIFPVELVRSKFTRPVDVIQLGMPEYAAIKKKYGSSLASIGWDVWNRIVHGTRHKVDPMALGYVLAAMHGPRSAPANLSL
jgi:hypothetical protein